MNNSDKEQTSTDAEGTLLNPLVSDADFITTEILARLPAIGIGLACMILLIFLAGPISRLAIRPINYLSQSQLISVVARRVVSFIIIMLGVYIFLRLAGLTQFAVAIISGTGLAGLIVGFAFKDIAENFISSLLLSVQKPFKIGDVVEVSGHLGVIDQVTSRATTLVDFDGNHIQIPNAIIYKSVIKNFTANPNMRGHFVIGIGYDSSVVKAQKIAERELQRHKAVLADPAPMVLVDNLGSATVNMKIYYWLNSSQNSLFKVNSQLQRIIMRELEAAGISMPDDARERVIIHTNADTAETPAPAAPVKTKNDKKQQVTDTDRQHHDEDTETEVSEIKKQADAARSPEAGDNIL